MPSSPLSITRDDVSTVQYSQCQVSEAVVRDNRNDVYTLQNHQGHVSVSQDSDGNTAAYYNHDDVQDTSSGSVSGHGPSDYILGFVLPFIDTDPIGTLENMLRETTDPAQQKNIQVAIKILKAGADILYGEVIADSKLVKGEEWKPVVGPFFTNTMLSVPRTTERHVSVSGHCGERG